MTATLILWSHALAALLFGATALGSARRGAGSRAVAAAAAATALWALAVAGIGVAAPVTGIVAALRTAAWLWALVALSARDGGAGRALRALAVVAGGVALIDAGVALPSEEADIAAVDRARLILGALSATGALLVVAHYAGLRRARAGGGVRLFATAPALLWGGDLALVLAGDVAPGAVHALIAIRGGALVVAALLVAVAPLDRGLGPLSLSRTLSLRLVAGGALILYAGLMTLAADGAAVLLGGEVRAVRTAIVFGAMATLFAALSTPRLRAWLRVKLGQHLYGHRYDYRVEWQRFTATLGRPGDGSDSLEARIVQATANLTDSPAGLLLSRDGDTLAVAAAWRWCGTMPGGGAAAGLAAHLAAGHIVALDEPAREGAPPVPAWLRTVPEAWAIVPLLHGDDLAGAIVLARPPVDRPLDWEDVDLLRVAGRQAASYLAEDRAHSALAEAQRFDEFNRRFAFLLHDIKNVASQLTLVARNAERHAENPAFRADMIATLRTSAARMTTLLARLAEREAAGPEGVRTIDLAGLAHRLAAARRAQHPVAVEAGAPCMACVAPQRLEQALGHLIQNAVEASAPDAAVVLRIATVAGEAVIEVRDTGRGMSPGFVRDHLFRPFASAKAGGFGIGAFEARQLIGAMDGTLEVESREGAGSVFRIRLPAADAAALEIAA